MAVEGDEKVIDACRCLQVMMRLSLRWRWMKDASSACPLAPVVTGLGLRVGPVCDTHSSGGRPHRLPRLARIPGLGGGV